MLLDQMAQIMIIKQVIFTGASFTIVFSSVKTVSSVIMTYTLQLNIIDAQPLLWEMGMG